MVDGIETVVAAGSAAFIPAKAEHGIRNVPETVLKLLYVFPTDRFSEVSYRFLDPAREKAGTETSN